MHNRASLPVLALILGACSDTPPTASGPSSQPTAITVQTGDGQTEVVARTLPDQLVARVTDARGRPVRNANVLFEVVSGGGSIEVGARARTDTAGLARAVWRLGTSAAAEQVARARVVTSSGTPSGIDVTFRAAGLPDIAWFVEVESSGQTIEPAPEFTRALVGHAYDQFRNPVPNTTVRWSAPMAGTLRDAETVTGPDGTTDNEWTVRATSGPTLGAGAYWITATSPSANVFAGAPLALYTVIVGDARLAATAVAVGASHACAVADAGQVYCWGDDIYGELGDAIRTSRAPYAAPMATGADPVTQIVAGRAHTCALTTAGKALCWGANSEGQLGNGTQAFSSAAVAVEQSGTFVSLVAGEEHTCGLTGEGVAFCWGANQFGQLGDGSVTAHATPTKVAGGERFTTLTAGVYHTCGLTTNGRTVCWGSDEFGQIGTATPGGSCPIACVTIPTSVEGSFVGLSAGMEFTCGVEGDGAAWCWGARLQERKQVGDVGRFSSLVGSQANDACGMTSEGHPYCWTFYYDDYYYYDDDDDRAGLTWPQQVGGAHAFSMLRLGDSRACGIERSDAPWVVCWGALPSETRTSTEPVYILRTGRP